LQREVAKIAILARIFSDREEALRWLSFRDSTQPSVACFFELHCVFTVVPRTEEFALAVNLTLPTEAMRATAKSKHLRGSCKAAFAELQTQTKKHLAHLCKDYEWKRKWTREVAIV
jgi:ribosome-associated translation inhibitor RaiA